MRPSAAPSVAYWSCLMQLDLDQIFCDSRKAVIWRAVSSRAESGTETRFEFLALL